MSESQRIFIMTMDVSDRKTLLERAQKCLNHHHACDCREAHWLALVDNIEAENKLLKKQVEKLKLSIAKMRETIEQNDIQTLSEDDSELDELMRGIAPPEGMKVSEWCRKTHIQLCHCCDDLDCQDNITDKGNSESAQ